ncbi:uncharacterized protein LOC143497328 [Brachyhypopomus gauderio]|uniref:uncharacterized protein LOC143497328 n=1 Tax=Brachyhypopomus gauderio TaxID=698409 RepID=UPI004042008F
MGQSLGASACSTSIVVETKRSSPERTGSPVRVDGRTRLEHTGDRLDGNPMKSKQLPRLKSYRPNAVETGSVFNDYVDLGGQKKLNNDRSVVCKSVSDDERVSVSSGRNLERVLREGTSWCFDADFSTSGLCGVDLSELSDCGEQEMPEKDYDWDSSPMTMENCSEGPIREGGDVCPEGKAQRLPSPVYPAPVLEERVKQTAPNRRFERWTHCCVVDSLSVPSDMTKTPSCTATPKVRRLDDGVTQGNTDQESLPSFTEEYSGVEVLMEYRTFPGTIPRLIVTRDPSPTEDPQGSPSAELALGLSGLSLDRQLDEESACSDSGCGGSPVQYFPLRKLSSSSSAGLSSASSFEESEDDYTGSDVEPASLSPSACGMFANPDELAGTKAWRKLKRHGAWFAVCGLLQEALPIGSNWLATQVSLSH